MHKQIPNDHLANERTLLAWVRTGIGIMAFGFVVVKFSFFIKQLSILMGTRQGLENGTLPEHNGFSSFIGIALVVLGALSLFLSFIKYKKTEKQLLAQNYRTSSRLIFALILTIFIMSLFLIWYLIRSVQHS